MNAGANNYYMAHVLFMQCLRSEVNLQTMQGEYRVYLHM